MIDMMSMIFSERSSAIVVPSIEDDSDESPFDNSSSGITTMYSESILHPYTKEYQTVLTLSNMPGGSLARVVHRMRHQRLSEFDVRRNPGDDCTMVICRFPVKGKNFSINRDDIFMTNRDIDSVFAYLRNNNYVIETQLTKLTNKLGGRFQESRRMVCMFSM
jgi:hypothetical protein